MAEVRSRRAVGFEEGSGGAQHRNLDPRKMSFPLGVLRWQWCGDVLSLGVTCTCVRQTWA